MRITHLSLTNFRNYARLELELPAGPILLHGNNAQGKTNFLEAIFYLATSRSPQADSDQQLLNWQAAAGAEPVVVGRLVAQLALDDGPRSEQRLLELRLIRERQRGRDSFRREALVNRKKVRLMDLLGQLRVVLFLPQDIQLITGPPADRRRYMDITLCMLDPAYCRALSAYNKVLEQRNAQLRQIAETGRGRDVLPIFTERLVELGSTLFSQRARLLAGLGRRARRVHYEELTDGQETSVLHYLPRLQPHSLRGSNADEVIADSISLAEWLQDASHQAVAARFAALLDQVKETDIARARTTVGPQRDDWRFWVNGRPLSVFGSRGQQRSAILALKVAEIAWIEAETGETPVLLLDEVAAELDERRRELLLAYVRRASQAVVTATEVGMFTPDFLQAATVLKVAAGQLQRDAAIS